MKLTTENAAIIEAKLLPQSCGGNMLFRERLLRRILDRDTGIIVLNAPAGYGKTVLLSQWAGLADIPVVWYKLDEADNNPAIFFKYLFTGISRYTGHMAAYEPLLGNGAYDGAERANAMVALITGEMERLKADKLGIVLDDFHCLNSRPVLDFMDNLIKYLPGGLKAAIAGRGASALNISRLIYDGAALEVTSDDLAFTPGEFAECVASGNGMPQLLKNIYEKCEGWPLGLSIAAEAYRKSGAPAGGPLRIEFPDDRLSGFFAREIMDRLPEELRQFLTATSVLENLSPAACTFLTGREDAEDMLEYLYTRNMFVVKRHDGAKTYVCHRLLREFLLQALGKRSQAFFKKAGEFYLHNGAYDEAVKFFIEAQDGENTLKALKKIGIPALCGGNPDKVERWLLPCKGACPPDNGWLELFEGAVCMCRGLTREANRLVKNAYEKFYLLNDREGLCLAVLLLSKILAYKGDFEGSLILSDYVLAGGADIDDNLYYNMAMQKAFCLSVKGEFDAGILAAETGAEVLNRRGNRLFSALLQRFLVLPYYMKGDYKKALYYYYMAKDAVGDELPRNDQLLVDLFVSRSYRDTGDFEKSRELFENTIHMEKSLKYSENLYVTYYHYSLLFSDSGDFSEALHYICLSEELAVNGGVSSWFLDVPAGHKSFLLSQCGKPEEGLAIARKLLERIGQNKHFLFSGALFYSGFTFLQGNECHNAERCMQEAFSISKSAGFGIIECYSAGMLSYIYSQSGRSGQAEEYANVCLALAAAGNYMQGFITIPQMLECIKTGLAKGYEPDFISRVLGRMDRTPQFRAVIDSMQKIFFTGTPRERDNIFETLGRLSASGSVSGIPRIFVCTFENMKIYVTGEGPDTEKWRTNKAKELFAYLLNKRGAAVSSEKLITELWPGSPPDKARSLLYANIVHIKSKLGQWGLSDKLKKVQNGYLIEEKDVFCDKWLVDGELESYGNRRKEKPPEWLAGILKNRSFMEDIYSDWVLEEQNKLEIMIDGGA